MTFHCCFAETPDGKLMIADGVSRMQHWDGLRSSFEDAGVDAPASAATIAGSSSGGIVGTYAAYVRFKDRDGNFSNLSPISNVLTPSSSTGTITGATNATPIVITSTAHGLSTNAIVKITGVGGNSSANNTWTITRVDADSFSLNNSSGTDTYTGGGTWKAGVSTIAYTAVPVPSQAKVTSRQLLRNTDGQATTFYVDVDTTDLTSTSFNSTNTDTTLGTQTAVTLLNADGSPLANRFGTPPDHKAIVVHHLGRMFAAGEVSVTAGVVSVTNGSATVTGIGTSWTSYLANRYLYVAGATAKYLISSVNTTSQTLTLSTVYGDTTNAYAAYAIRPAPAERRLVYYSESGLPEAWPATNAVSLQEDSDEITGLMVQDSFVYIVERRHIYKFTFQSNPSTDGYVFLASASRGCINQRCWVSVNGVAYLMDEQGIHKFDGDDSEPVSTPIQDIFRPNDGPYEINWAASDNFHCVHYAPQEVVRWFVCLSGHYLPRHALCYNYRLERWWIEEFTRPIGASVQAHIGGRPVPLLGSSAKQVFAFWSNTLDGPDGGSGTVRGTVTSATLTSLTDSAATFPGSGLVNASVAIVDGTGKGQVRQIIAVTSSLLTVSMPWLVTLDTTSVYQIGGVHWLWRTPWFRFADDERETTRRLELVYEPTRNPALASARLQLDSDSTFNSWQVAYPSAAANGVRSDKGLTDLVIDLTKTSGFAQKRLDGRKEFFIDGPRFHFWEFEGWTNLDEAILYQLTLDGVR